MLEMCGRSKDDGDDDDGQFDSEDHDEDSHSDVAVMTFYQCIRIAMTVAALTICYYLLSVPKHLPRR